MRSTLGPSATSTGATASSPAEKPPSGPITTPLGIHPRAPAGTPDGSATTTSSRDRTSATGAGPLTVPGLVLVGARDVVHPAATARQIAERLGADCREFPEMSHWLPGEPGWDLVARTVLTWLDGVGAAA